MWGYQYRVSMSIKKTWVKNSVLIFIIYILTTFFKTLGKLYLTLDQNYLFSIPYPSVNCLKSKPFTGARTHIAYTWEYPHSLGCYLWWRLHKVKLLLIKDSQTDKFILLICLMARKAKIEVGWFSLKSTKEDHYSLFRNWATFKKSVVITCYINKIFIKSRPCHRFCTLCWSQQNREFLKQNELQITAAALVL